MIVGKLAHKTDLLLEINKVVKAQGIEAGVVHVMGSLSRARLSFYDQKLHAYREMENDAPHEIVSGMGNISLKDGAPFVHLHLAVSDNEGKVVGGHCIKGCTVFAVEFVIWPIKGAAPVRVLDPVTGLYIWEKDLYT